MSEIRPAEYKTFVMTALALALAVWPLAFNIGAFRTVFFDEIFRVWVAASVIFVVSFVVPERLLDVSWRGQLVMGLPSIWVIVALLSGRSVQEAANEPLLGLIGLVVVALALPYSIYVWAILVTPDFERIRRGRLRWALVGMLVAISLVGFTVGRNNHFFLTCEDFKVSGNDLPTNCVEAPAQ